MTLLDTTRAAVDVARKENRIAFDFVRTATRVDLDAAGAGDYDPEIEAANIAAIVTAVGVLNRTTNALHAARAAYRDALLDARRAAQGTTKETTP